MDAVGVHGLSPETGDEYWSQPWKLDPSAMSISTPRFENGLLFLTCFYRGAMTLKLSMDKPSAAVVWKSKNWKGNRGSEQSANTDALQSIISTPFMRDGFVYGVCSYGELRCLKLDTG